MRKLLFAVLSLGLAACGKPSDGGKAKAEGPRLDAPAPAAPERAEKGLAFFYVLPSEEDACSSVETTDFYFYSEGETLRSAIAELMSDSQAVEYRRVSEGLLYRKVDIRCRVMKVKGADNKARLRRTVMAGLAAAFTFTIIPAGPPDQVLIA